MPAERLINSGQGPIKSPDQEPNVDVEALVKQLEIDIGMHSTREYLSSGSTVRFEDFSSPITGLTGAVAHFGEEVTRPEMDAKIKQMLEENPEKSAAERWLGPIGYTAGFGTVWRTPDRYSQQEIDNDTFEVALGLARRVLEQKSWKADEVDIVDFANSAADKGMAETLRKKLIEELRMREDVEVTGTFLACDGAGNALFKRLSNPDSQEKKVLLLSVDQVTSEMPLDPEQIDTLSMQLFSNGAAGFAYQPGVDLKFIVGTTEMHEDIGVGGRSPALAASPRYAPAIDAIDALDEDQKKGLIDGIIYKIGENEWAIKMPKDAEGKKGKQDGKHTAFFFWNGGESNIISTADKYEKKFSGRSVDHATGHQPSYEVIQGLLHRFEKLEKKTGRKVYLPLKWVVPDGNSSGATSLIAFLRSMSQFKPGDHVFYASFGAGGSFTSFVVEIGGEKQEETSVSGHPEQIAAYA